MTILAKYFFPDSEALQAPPPVGCDPLSSLKYPGYRICRIGRSPNRLDIYLEPEGDPICPSCGAPCHRIHDIKERTVRDVSVVCQEEVYVHFPVRRVRCHCGCHKTEVIDWVEPRARITNALVALIQTRMRNACSVISIGRDLNLSWNTVRDYEELLLDKLFSDVDVSHVQNIAIDEFSVHKGHRYATVALDLDQKQIIWVGLGKSKLSLEPFFNFLKDKGVTDQIKSVSCDMNAAYPSMVREHLPLAEIVYDEFHVMHNFVHDVLAEGKRFSVALVRDGLKEQMAGRRGRRKKSAEPQPTEPAQETQPVQAAQAVPAVQTASPQGTKAIADSVLNTPASPELLRDLNSSEWILVKRKDDLDVNQKVRLDRLIHDNALMASLYPVADMLRGIWQSREPEESRSRIVELRGLLKEISIRFCFKPAARFARMLKRREDGLVYAGKFGYGTSRLEGVNNAIKVQKRLGYGYRNFRFFSLKIKSLFPGTRNNPWTEVYENCAILKNRLWFSPVFPAKT